MLKAPTVFVIGAGAGVDIGMPVGSALSADIAKKLYIMYDRGYALKSGDPILAAALKKVAKDRGEDYNEWRASACTVAKGIEYTRSIDAYLNSHRDNEKVKIAGKLAITQCILEYEKGSSLYIKRGSGKGFQARDKVLRSWLSDFLYLLQDNIVASENLDEIFKNVCIINFNYDRCIEHFLCYALQELYQITENRAFELMQRLIIFHPYGSVGHMPWAGSEERKVGFGVTDYGDLVGLAGEIHTFNEQLEERRELLAMRAEISTAERIIFIGFHFHRQNMELLRSIEPARGGFVNIYATALDRSEADKTFITKEIQTMLETRGGTWNINVEKETDCKKLFKDYSATWLR